MTSVDKITKEAFDTEFKEMIEVTEEAVTENMDMYKKLIKFRKQYRQDYKTHRIFHYRAKDGTITYRKGASRTMGFGK